jgi:hypothetical protein
MATSTTNGKANTPGAYETVASDYTGDCYRPNQITRSINGRLVKLESAASAAGSSAAGATEATTSQGYVVETISAGAITPNISTAVYHEVTLISNSAITINNPGGTVTVGMLLTLVILQDATGNRPAPLWGTKYKGVGTGTTISPDSSSQSLFNFVVRTDGNLQLTTFSKGITR